MIEIKQLIRIADIQRLLKCSYKKAKKYFEVTKPLDNDPFNLRQTEVPLKLFCKTHGFDYRLAQETLKKELAPTSPNEK